MLFEFSAIPKGLGVRWLTALEPVILRRFHPKGVISIAFISEREMRRLNMLYRGKDRPTDVLSFRLDEVNSGSSVAPDQIVAEIVLNRTYLAAHAKERGRTLQQEFQHMLIHGIVHTLGYDHERPREARAMEAVERSLIRAVQENLGKKAGFQYTKGIPRQSRAGTRRQSSPKK